MSDIAARIEALAKKIETSPNSTTVYESVSDWVHDAFADAASKTCNQGIQAQLAALIELGDSIDELEESVQAEIEAEQTP